MINKGKMKYLLDILIDKTEFAHTHKEKQLTQNYLERLGVN